MTFKTERTNLHIKYQNTKHQVDNVALDKMPDMSTTSKTKRAHQHYKIYHPPQNM